jgi:hypothetical protein
VLHRRNRKDLRRIAHDVAMARAIQGYFEREGGTNA